MNDKLVVTGYIIKSVTYLENDAIVTILSADGLLTFKARGVKKITSKLARLINLYSYVELELTKTGKHYILTNGTVITSNSQIYNSLDSMCLLGLISECPEELRHLINDSDPYISSEAAYAISYLGYPEEGIKNLVYPVKEENRKIGYSSLECLSLDSNMRKYIREYLNELRNNAETLPRIQNEDAGLMARGILVNLGELDIDLLHGEEAYKAGLKLNYGRRPMVPLPY